MRRKDYEKPTAQVVKFEDDCDILSGSSVQIGVQDYNWTNEEDNQTGLHNYNWNNLDEE